MEQLRVRSLEGPVGSPSHRWFLKLLVHELSKINHQNNCSCNYCFHKELEHQKTRPYYAFL